MPYTLQMLRALMEDHPDRVGNLRIHVESLENSIENQPAFCLQSVRTLFETVQLTIAPIIGVDLSGVTEFPARNGRIVKALDFSIRNHPDAAEIDAVIKKLLGSINGTISALAELSNIPGLRHGGSLDWGTLQRQHARMLGGLCDALVRFLFDVAWSRPSADAPEPEPERYDDFAGFNEWLDDEYGMVEIVGAWFQPSRILHALDPTLYNDQRAAWAAEQNAAASDQEAA
ncbi:abortive infection family protein [Acidibrevibacterium fodinaquatile]|uniref:abortive infection family protein n=1 Tax=Acidibrevibacterium fodinaquatile TaxID=1969806 RepID=UPI000E0DF81D|nr:abortive infection family protein [Acidibrevibacterium fodinaquatile]